MKKYFLLSIVLLCATFFIGRGQDNEFGSELHTVKQMYAKYGLDDHPSVAVDTDLIGIWKMAEDTDPHNYFVIEKYNDNRYAFTYMTRGGSNRTYENDGAFFSDINGTRFINVGYYDWDSHSGEYFFLKVIEIKNRGFDMTLELVADTTLKDISDPKEVRERIAKNLNNRDYYKKPVHFHKILPLMYCK